MVDQPSLLQGSRMLSETRGARMSPRFWPHSINHTRDFVLWLPGSRFERVGVRSLSQFSGLLSGFTFLAPRVSGATGAGASPSMFGELFGGKVSEGTVSKACDV